MYSSSNIGKVEKAKRYAEERSRFTFTEFVVKMRGDNSEHIISYKDDKFFSEGPFFKKHGYSAHTMAMEKVLVDMIASPAESDELFTMDSSYVSKVEKAKRYAEERGRIEFVSFVVNVQGENSDHIVTYDNGKFDSDSTYFKQHGYSVHTMALEHILKDMIPSVAEQND